MNWAKGYDLLIKALYKVKEEHPNFYLKIAGDGPYRNMLENMIDKYYLRKNIFSDLIVKPITGRSHQIRIHLASFNMPILGDSLYAHKKAFLASSRLLLHSKILKLKHPITEKKLIFKSKEKFN